MIFREVVQQLETLKVSLWIDGHAVKFKPASVVSQELRAGMIEHKQQLRNILAKDFKTTFATRTKALEEKRRSRATETEISSTGGVGTEIKKILARFGIVATPNCSCNRNAKLADQWGPDECEKRADEIIGWMRVEATKRRLPFFDPVGRMILRRAIRAARKN